MPRARTRPPEHENHDRWLVSYADFITLLFAFFVVMFATAQTDKGKAQQVSDSVKKALAGQPLSEAVSAILGNGQKAKRPVEHPPPPLPSKNVQRHSPHPPHLFPSPKILDKQ